MGRNNDGGILTDVAGCLLRAGFHDERAESTEIHVLTMSETVPDHRHKLFDNSDNDRFVNAGCLSYFAGNFCFSHFVSILS